MKFCVLVLFWIANMKTKYTSISVVLVRPCNFSFSFSYSKLDKTF